MYCEIWVEGDAEMVSDAGDRTREGATEEALYCPICEYNLTGLVESRCPECGEGFDRDELNRPANAEVAATPWERQGTWGSFLRTWWLALFDLGGLTRRFPLRCRRILARQFTFGCYAIAGLAWMMGAAIPPICNFLAGRIVAPDPAPVFLVAIGPILFFIGFFLAERCLTGFAFEIWRSFDKQSQCPSFRDIIRYGGAHCTLNGAWFGSFALLASFKVQGDYFSGLAFMLCCIAIWVWWAVSVTLALVKQFPEGKPWFRMGGCVLFASVLGYFVPFLLCFLIEIVVR